MPTPTRSLDCSISTACGLLIATLPFLNSPPRSLGLSWRCCNNEVGAECRASRLGGNRQAELLRGQTQPGSQRIIPRQPLQIFFIEMVVDIFRQIAAKLCCRKIH